MEISKDLSGPIIKRLQQFIRDPANADEFREYSKSLGALMLFLDMGGFYAIRPDGDIIWCEWDSETPTPCVEKDARIRNFALYQGSKKYPELAVLIPPRTETDVDCPHCLGTGISRLIEELNSIQGPEKQMLTSIICYCGGLGWLPKETPDEFLPN